MQKDRNRIFEYSIYIIVFIVTVLLFYRFAVQNSERIEKQNEEYAMDAVQQLGGRLEDQFRFSQELITSAAWSIGQSFDNGGFSASLLNSYGKRLPFSGLRFTDRDGMALSGDGEIRNMRESEYFQEGLRGESGMSVILKPSLFHEPLLIFYAPVISGGKIVGVLDGTYQASRFLAETLRATYFGRVADVYFCQRDGQIIGTSGAAPLHGDVLSGLLAANSIDAAVVGDAQRVIQAGGHASYTLTKETKSGNLCIYTLPAYGYVLVQAFPQAITDNMISNADNAGVQLEASLFALFACAAGFLLLRARLNRKFLEKRNRELAMIINGMNILFSGRYLLLNAKTGVCRYVGEGSASRAVGESGEYTEVVKNLAAMMPDPIDRREIAELFSQHNMDRHFRDFDTLTYTALMEIDGKEEWENIIGICLAREDGMPAEILMVRQNITEMKKREIRAQKQLADMGRKERQYQLALTSNALASYEFNVSRDELSTDVKSFVNGNPISLLQEHGLAAPCKASDFLASWQPLLLPESAEEYAAKTDVSWLRRRFYEGAKEVDLDFWIQDAFGNETCLRQSFYLASDDLSGDVMAMTVMRDITAQVVKQRSQTKALQDALLLAQHASEAKTTFLSNMSHDIRTPMNAIIGFSSIAISHLDNQNQVRDCLQKVLSSSNHLLSLINDILDMSRIESGKLQIKEQPCNISEVMHNLVTIIQPQVKAKQMNLFIDTFDVVNEDVITDPLKLNQVFINLLGNAVKYTPAGGKIEFHLTQKPAFRHGYAEYIFEVRDNGIGMSPEFVEHIFEPFTRETTTTQSGIQGTGLGMAITKNIIEMMHGEITVESEPGKGSTFIVTLTLRLQEGDEAVIDVKALEGQRALVVDDDFHVCDSVSKMLQKLGMRPEWTTSGREAAYRTQIACNDNDPFHTFIIDWQMPEMNGVDTARKIRDIAGKDKPIIILTAYEWADIEEEAKRVGVTAFCAKPLFLSDLRNALLSSHNAAQTPQPEEPREHFKNARILLVDDLEMNREVAEFILTESGFIVETAPDGTDAVEMVSSSPEGYYDAILMDVQMPTMNGYEATRAIRKLPREDVNKMPIIAMTANALEEDRAQALQYGMNDHIAKPIDIKVFFEVLSKYFKKIT